MENKDQDFEVENMLENWQKKPLDDTAMLAAQNRVWSKISTKTSALQSNSQAKNSTKHLLMPDENNTVNLQHEKTTKSLKTWFLKPLNMSLAGLVLVLILTGTGTLIYLNKQNQNMAQQLALQKEVQNAKNNINPISKTDLSLDQIRGLATIKLNTLTSGISLDQIKEASSKNTKLSLAVATGTGLGAAVPDSKLVNSPDAETLVREKGVIDNLVYYTKSLTTESNGGYLYGYLSKISGFDMQKPIQAESWSSANYSKYIISQDGKILSYNTYSPESSIEFKGGKYAIREIFDQKLYLSGLSQDSNNTNSELSFLKSILSDTSLKDEGLTIIDGKKYKILSSQNSTPPYPDYGSDLFGVKYYIDQDKLSVFKTENYKNNKLVSSTVQTANQEIKDPNLDQLFGVNDLGNIELKTVNTPPFEPSSNQLLSVSKKGDIYLPSGTPDVDLKSHLYAIDSSVYAESEATKLRNTLDFDPSLDEAYLKTILNPPAVNYSIDSFSVNVFKGGIPAEEYLSVKKQENKTIKLDNKEVKAVYKEVIYEYGPSQSGGVESSMKALDPEISYRLEFQAPNGLWYQMTEFKAYAPDSKIKNNIYFQDKNISLSKLSPDLVVIISQFQDQKQRSYPEIDYETKIENISKNIRILPGNLLKDYNLGLSSVSKSKKLGSLTTCEKFLTVGFELSNCLIEKYNGFSLSYYEKELNNQISSSDPQGPSSSSPQAPMANQNDLTFTVLDTKFENIDLAKYIETINRNSSKTINPTSVKIGGDSKVKEFNYNDGYTDTTLYFTSFKDQTIIANSSKLNKTQLLDIIQKSNFDKDLVILSEQMKQLMMSAPVSAPSINTNK